MFVDGVYGVGVQFEDLADKVFNFVEAVVEVEETLGNDRLELEDWGLWEGHWEAATLFGGLEPLREFQLRLVQTVQVMVGFDVQDWGPMDQIYTRDGDCTVLYLF